MSKVFHRTLVAVGCLASLSSSELHGDDFATWSGVFVKTLDTKHLDLITFGQVRFYNNSRDFLQYFVSQRFVVEVNPYLETGINYTYLPTRLSTDVDFWRQHRMELVLTPRWPVTERTTLELRNWLELRWFDGLTGPRERSRHRLGVSHRLDTRTRLRSLYAHNEFFIDYTINEFNQNRLVPLGVTLGVTDHTSVSLHYMLQSIRGLSQWNHAHILGTTFNVTF